MITKISLCIIVVDNEYKTPTQRINKGSFLGLYTINPSQNKTFITDMNIQTELTAQIIAGHLPTPTLDVQNNPQTYYALFFPPGITIADPAGAKSCTQFCAYHSTVAAAGSINQYYYGVHPDFQPGSRCASVGCGSGDVFQKYCQEASHELAEMITGIYFNYQSNK